MTQRTVKKLAFWLLWVGVVVYAFVFAPPDQPDTLELIQHLATGQIQGINPLIVALFNIMGIWPLIYACLMIFDGRVQKIWAWPFLVASFAVGAFAIIPYLALREPNDSFKGSKNLFLKVLDSRWLGVAIALGAFCLALYGLTQGDWADFVAQWQTSRFIHVTSLDFCLLWLLVSNLIGDDMARRGMHNPGLFWFASGVPLLGAVLYLVVRSPIQEQPEADRLSEQAISLK